MYLIAFQKKETKKKEPFIPSHNIFIQLIDVKLKIEKAINFFFTLFRKKGIGTKVFLYFTAIYFFFLSTPPKRKSLLLYPDEEKWK